MDSLSAVCLEAMRARDKNDDVEHCLADRRQLLIEVDRVTRELRHTNNNLAMLRQWGEMMAAQIENLPSEVKERNGVGTL